MKLSLIWHVWSHELISYLNWLSFPRLRFYWFPQHTYQELREVVFGWLVPSNFSFLGLLNVGQFSFYLYHKKPRISYFLSLGEFLKLHWRISFSVWLIGSGPNCLLLVFSFRKYTAAHVLLYFYFSMAIRPIRCANAVTHMRSL